MPRPGPLYFAYGCNMDQGFLAELIGLPITKGRPARADGWRLSFNKGGEGEHGKSVVANLERDEGRHALGVVYRLPREALPALDAFEGVPEHYRRETIWVQALDGRASQPAIAYLAQPRWVVEEGRTEKDYLNLLLRGARIHGLPLEYLNWVHATATGTTGGA